MTIQEIVDQAYTLSNEPIDLFKARRFINEAMEILAQKYDTACVKATLTINCTDNVDYSLPSDCIGVYKVTKEGLKYNNFLADSGTITFSNLGTYIVTYLKVPKLTDRKLYDKTLGTDIPTIDISYHRCLPSYLASQVLFLEDANNPKIQKFISDFNNIAENVSNKLNKLKRKGARLKAPLWR